MGFTKFVALYAVAQVAAVAQILAAPASSEMIVSGRPLGDATRRLEAIYGKVVSYEDPVLERPGDVYADPRLPRELLPKTHAFNMPLPANGNLDLESTLNTVLNAFHAQTFSARFRIVKSAWGYHVVPLQARDASGDMRPAPSLLDTPVAVPVEVRSADGHLRALVEEITHVTGIRTDVSAIPYTRGGFDQVFRAIPGNFAWGAIGVSGRNALIDLLDRSATTFSWRLNCQAGTEPAARACVLSLERLIVRVTDQDGHAVERVVNFDRCGNCPPLREGQ